MYRCYLIRDGRIARGEDIDRPTFEEAIADARATFGSDFEVWQGASLVHREKRHGRHDRPGPVASPFETAESTMYPTWRPTRSRPIGMAVMAHAT